MDLCSWDYSLLLLGCCVGFGTCGMLTGERGRSFRRKFGIVAFVGANGSGKTLTAVHDCLPSLMSGRPVLSTVRLLDFEHLRPCELSSIECGFSSHPDHCHPHPLWIPFRSWDDILHAEHCDVLMDEVTGVASSRDSLSLPSPVANLLVQLRRRDVVLRWTSPSWRRADAIIRECSQAAVVCRGFFPRGVDGQLWPSNRLIRARTVDARDLDDLTAGRAAREKALDVSWMRLEGLSARVAYDTLDSVMSLRVVEGGRCAVCGGRRSVPKCSCETDAAAEVSARTRSEHAGIDGAAVRVSPRHACGSA